MSKYNAKEIKNVKMSDEDFFKMREEVLGQWETGKDVTDLKANIEFAKSVPAEKNFALKLEAAIKDGKVLIQPRAGVGRISEHVELLQFLEGEGEADLLPNTIDSYTRQNRYENCQNGIEESMRQGKNMLNGFPAVNHGVKGCRRVYDAVISPLQARHGTPDARLLSEIIYASGWTSNEGGAISYNLPYSKAVPMENTLVDWQYIDRLTAMYEEAGVPINREPYGPLTGTLVPPSMSNAVAIIEALLAAKQGVKSITVGYGQCGNQTQDIAAIVALREQTEEYIKKQGDKGCVISTVFHQWMGAFPMDEAKAYGVIANAAVTASLAGVTKMIVKTTHEAFGIPTKEANANGLKCTKMVVNLIGTQRAEIEGTLKKEVATIKKEVSCIIDAIYKLGDGDLAQGVLKGIEAGVIDIPFAPAKINKGEMLPARDNDGFIRYLRPGCIPFTKDILEFNRKKLDERAKVEGRDVNFKMTADDIFAIASGKLIGRPPGFKE